MHSYHHDALPRILRAEMPRVILKSCHPSISRLTQEELLQRALFKPHWANRTPSRQPTYVKVCLRNANTLEFFK